mmetsp:Transcript_11314/g.28422  ORF Transcript_11314/g.28422 Transcript_11314/m.28422 type:complete len:222 (+) Transcript_11314:407-1072(+)
MLSGTLHRYFRTDSNASTTPFARTRETCRWSEFLASLMLLMEPSTFSVESADSKTSAPRSSRPFQRKFAAALRREMHDTSCRRCSCNFSVISPSSSLCSFASNSCNFCSSSTARMIRLRAPASMPMSPATYSFSKPAQARSKSERVLRSLARKTVLSHLVVVLSDFSGSSCLHAMRELSSAIHAIRTPSARPDTSSLRSKRSPLTQRVLVHTRAASKMSAL